MRAAEHAALRAREKALLGAGVGVCATALAIGGHVIGGGATPSPLVLAALVSVAVAACVVLSQARWRLPALFGAFVVMQAAFHLVLGAQPGSSMHAGHMSGHSMAGHSHVTHAATTGFGWQMLAAHVAAVLVTALAFRRGAHVCRLTAEVLIRPFAIIRDLLAPPPSFTPAHPRIRETRRASKLPQLVLCAAPRRGPPAPLAT